MTIFAHIFAHNWILNICKVWMELNNVWCLYCGSSGHPEVWLWLLFLSSFGTSYIMTGLCDSYSVVSSCGLMDSDSQGPSKGGTGESWCPAAPGPACWTDISLLQEDLSFCVTGIFFMGFLSFAMWSHLLTPALRRFSVVRSGSTFICSRSKFAENHHQRAACDSACMLLIWGPLEGCIQAHTLVILIPTQISLQKQTNVDGCHGVWMLRPWKIYAFFSWNVQKKKNKTVNGALPGYHGDKSIDL